MSIFFLEYILRKFEKKKQGVFGEKPSHRSVKLDVHTSFKGKKNKRGKYEKV